MIQYRNILNDHTRAICSVKLYEKCIIFRNYESLSVHICLSVCDQESFASNLISNIKFKMKHNSLSAGINISK